MPARVGLAVFAADALSSVAYAPQETLVILATAGTSALGYAFPIAIAVTILLAIVTISYQQTVYAYPGGGGAYIVARDNLGELAAQTAGAALLVDYVLLAAVAMSSGVAQIVSAYPPLFPYRVEVAVGLLFLIMLINLRGVRESGITFAIPNYFFLVMIYLTVGVGFIRYLTGTLGTVVDPPPIETIIGHAMQPVTIFLLLRAFSNGTTALTGVECISNGITAFKEPRTRNAAITMIWMSLILGSLFLGITFLLHQIGAVPSAQETVISQLARTVYGSRNILYLATMIGTTIILFLATNTAFADFPRLSALQASDGFLPRRLTYRGSRLVYSRGIVTLGVIAALLIVTLSRQCDCPGAFVGNWSISFIHFIPVRYGASLVEDWAPSTRARDQGTRLDTEIRAGLAHENVDQWFRSCLHRGRNHRVCGHEIPGWRLDCGNPDPHSNRSLFLDPPALQESGSTSFPQARWDQVIHHPPPRDPPGQWNARGHDCCIALRSPAIERCDCNLCLHR